jgi:hypothetical protein
MLNLLAAQPSVIQAHEQLADEIASCYADPLKHVMISYPWGKGSLHGQSGPRKWQREFLVRLGEEVLKRGFDGVNAVDPIRFSTGSGHGIGKSALVAWIIRWLMDTRPFTKGVVTASTATQLRTKTWSELAKWHNIGITKHWYTLNTGMGSLNLYHNQHPSQWRFDAFTSKEENSESFAGLHAANSTPCYIFDEASGVPDKIFEVREGGLTDGEPMVFDFGNPTKNTGRFYQNMRGKFRHRYIRQHIDSRDVEGTNKELFDQWAKDYGEDSDFFKVRVRGEFPAQGSLQFISTALAEHCASIDVAVSPHEPLVMGIDVARFGDDRSVLFARQGRDCHTHGFKLYPEVDTMQLAAHAAAWADELNPDAIFVDGGGVGGGVVDRLRQLGYDVIDINFGSKATEKGYANLRAQMWGRMRDAMKAGIAIPDDDDLIADLTGVEYGYNIRTEIQLERKEDMKKRGLASPDMADAMAITYVYPVAPRSRAGYQGNDFGQTKSDYDPLA